MNSKKLTISDVAKYCGVSKTTISRYLNDKNGSFSEATRERIKSAIDELGYKPDRTAQRLKSARTKLVGCVLADISSPFTAILLKGIMKVCERAGYQVLFTDSGEDKKREIRAIEGFLLNRVDGIIVNTCGDNEDFLVSIRNQGVPIVLADRGLLGKQRLDTVSHCNEESAVECVSILKDCGYDRVAFFSQETNKIAPRVLRYRGYKKGIEEFFPSKEPELVTINPQDEDECARLLMRYRNAYPDERIAIISANGVTSRCILLASRKTGYEWGSEFGLCTYDDWEWLRLASPGITSVQLPSQKIGENAAQLLIEYIEGLRSLDDPPLDIQLPGKLNIRGSTVKNAR